MSGPLERTSTAMSKPDLVPASDEMADATGDPLTDRCTEMFRRLLGQAARANVATGVSSAVSPAVEGGRVTGVYLVRNPRELTRLDEPADLAR
jgi:RNA polymerase sigma-70 factor (ECF subfamily)